MSFEKLSPEAQKRYSEVNQRFGLAPDESTHTTITSAADACGEKSGPMVFSGDSIASHIPPKLINIGSIAEFKKLLGLPELGDDDHITYPETLCKTLSAKMDTARSKGDLKKQMSAADNDNLRLAAHAYILGDHKKVAAYEPMINTMMFPTQVAYFADPQPLVVDTPIVVEGPNPVVWNYSSIILEKGGSITQTTAPSFSINTETMDPDNGTTDFPINNNPGEYSGPAAKGPDGQTGGTGGPGNPGTSSQSTSSGSPWVCTKAPTNGLQGGQGTPGTPGSPGGAGADMSPLTINVGSVTGVLVINATAGAGQTGGQGGKGGDGGPGGPPGAQDAHKACTAASQGPQGPAGKGGDGGRGGNGGKGANVIVYYTTIGGNSINKGSALPGQGGIAGEGGTGNGGGGNGTNGDPGDPGTPPNVRLNKV